MNAWHLVTYYAAVSRVISPVTLLTHADTASLLQPFIDKHPELSISIRTPYAVGVNGAKPFNGPSLIKSTDWSTAKWGRQLAQTLKSAFILQIDNARHLPSQQVLAASQWVNAWQRELMTFHHASRILLTSAAQTSLLQRRYIVPQAKFAIVPYSVDTDVFTVNPDLVCEPGLIGTVVQQLNDSLRSLIDTLSVMTGLGLRLITFDERAGQAALTYARLRRVRAEVVTPDTPEQIALALTECELYVNTSEVQSLSRPVLWAMACGVPTIAASAHLTDTLSHAETAWLCERLDKACLESALNMLLSDSSLRSDISTGARRHVEEHFALERVVLSESSIYSQLI
ncbi:MAG: glycosyltransferase family 4 protein [Chloroflexi bacterium]|nr:glycosyltransferase family 4 protein [Chloroflexota bacterium]